MPGRGVLMQTLFLFAKRLYSLLRSGLRRHSPVHSNKVPMDNATPPAAPEEFETLVQPDDALPETTLEELADPLRQAVLRAGWPSLMPVQAKALPYLLKGQDLMVQSRTGSGKTGAFLLPILHLLDSEVAQTQALVLCPTRELARQVASEASRLFAGTTLTVCTVYGGVGYTQQTEELRAGAHLVVGTPGRILDHLLKRNMTVDGLRVLVFDEADRMLSIGFYPDMKEIKRYLPKRRVSTFLFSATYPPYVLKLAEEFMDRPNFLSLSAKQVHVADILHVYHEVPGMDKDRCLVRLIEMENPSSAIIFSNTKANVHYIAEVLKGFGHDAEELSADLTQAKREQVLERLRQGSLRFLVATDVAARGIAIPELSHVFQYEAPEDPESYVHRAGRTGRAGASGTAITLVNIMEELAIKRIGQRFGIDFVKKPAPTDEDVSAIVAARLTVLLEAEVRAIPALKKVRLQRFLPLARELAASGDEELLALLLDERYQATLHAAPPSPEGARPAEKKERSRDREGEPRRGHSARRREAPAQTRAPKPGNAPHPAAATKTESSASGAAQKPVSPGAPRVSADADQAYRALEAALDADAPGTPLSNPQNAPRKHPDAETATSPQDTAPEDGEQKKRKRRRRRRKKKPGQEDGQGVQGASLPQETSQEEADSSGDGYGFHAKPSPQAAPAEATQPQEPAKKPAKSRQAKPKATKADTGEKPAAEAAPKAGTAAARPKASRPRSRGKAPGTEAAPAKDAAKPTADFEYKPDEYKGIEWD